MKRRSSFATALIGASVASLLLVGCQSSGSTSNEEQESPLSEYMQALWGGSDGPSDEDYLQQEREIQDLLAQCMTQQGFEYTPTVYEGDFSFSPGVEEEEYDGPEWGSVEFAEQYGYGIVDGPWVDVMPTLPAPDEQEYTDPNWEYLDSLSESEQTAYYAALYGPEPTEEEYARMEEDPDYYWEPTDRGCYGEAEEQVYGSSDEQSTQFYDDPEFEDLMEAMNELWMGVESSPELAQLFVDWNNCMADRGQSDPSWTQRWDAESSLYEEWNDLHMSSASGEWSEPSDADRQSFQNREIEQAVADATCAKELNYDDTVTKIHTDAELAFIDQYKDRLDAMISKYSVSK